MCELTVHTKQLEEAVWDTKPTFSFVRVFMEEIGAGATQDAKIMIEVENIASLCNVLKHFIVKPYFFLV